MSALDKMWASFVAIGCMALASLLIGYARSRPRGILRIVLTVCAFLLFIPILLYGLVALF